jgi:hypothetical protein
MTDDVVTVEVGPFAPTPLQTTEVLASAIRIHRTRHRTVTSNGIVCGTNGRTLAASSGRAPERQRATKRPRATLNRHSSF